MKTSCKTSRSRFRFTRSIQTRQRMAIICLWVGSLLLGGESGSKATPGDLDLSFDPGSSLNGQVRGMAVQTNGSFVIAGNFTTVPGAMRNHAARFHPDGTVDPTFAPAFAQNGNAYLNIAALALQNDGKLLIGGTFNSVNGVTRSNLVRLHPDGSLDNSFLNSLPGPTGPLGTTVVGKIVVQNDGKLLIAGSFTSVNGIQRTNFARLNPDGTLDPAFLNGLAGPDGTTHGSVSCIALQSDGKILIGGEFTLANGMARPRLARLKADGSLDESFLNGLAGPDGNPSGVAIQPDGRVLVAGRFQAVNGVARTNLTRLNADGSLDESFLASLQTVGPGGIGPVFVLQGDGRILIGGGFALINGVGRTNLARLHPDGSLDASFLAQLPSLMSTDGGVSAFALQPDGKVLVSGISAFSPMNPYLSRLNGDGSPDNTGEAGRTGPNGRIRETSLQPDGRLLIVGDFTSVSGVARGGLARLLPNGALDDSFLQGWAGANRGAYTLALQRDGKVVIGGDLDTFNGIARKGIARVNADGALDESFAPNLEGKARAVYSLAMQSDGKILIGGSFTSINGLARTNLARLNPDGSSDSSFVGSVAGGSSDGVEVIVLQPDGRIVIGGFFSVVNGVSRNRIARLHSNGSLDTSFLNALSGMDQVVWAIAVQSDGKVVVGGWFNTINGADRKYLARLNANGTLDPSFLAGMAGPGGGVDCLTLQSDDKILVGGGFNSFNGVARGNLVRLHANGSVDNSFLNGLAGADQKVWCLALLPDSRIVIAGEFAAVNGIPQRSVARMMGDYTPPVIENPAQSQTAEEGNQVKLHITVVGYPLPAIQWFCNGVALSDCTNSTLEFLNAQPLHSGVYSAIITNAAGAVTSAPVMLNVIAAVARRPVPGINLSGDAGSLLNLDYADALSPALDWLPLDVVSLISTSQYCFDLTAALPPQRFYRVWQTGAPAVLPSLNLSFVPAITLTGGSGSAVRVEGINQLGPTDAWFTLDTVTLTNTSQLYFDVTASGQPTRLYRLAPVP